MHVALTVSAPATTKADADTKSEHLMDMSPGSATWRGILAIIIGLIALFWPGITIGAMVLIFAFYAFIDAGMEAVLAFSSRRAGPVIGRLLLAFLDVAAGVFAIAWPGITALALVWVIAFWAVITGVAEIFFAFGEGETAGERALVGLTGLVSIMLGIAFLSRPDIGAVTLAELFGLYALMAGVSILVVGANVRSGARNVMAGRAAA